MNVISLKAYWMKGLIGLARNFMIFNQSLNRGFGFAMTVLLSGALAPVWVSAQSITPKETSASAAPALTTPVAIPTGLGFPMKAITVVVPFPPGGTTDVLAREVLKQMQPNFKVPLVVLNKDGASGTLGSELVSRAAGDAHWLLLTATHHVINPSLLKVLPYDTRKSFTPITLIGSAPNVLIANVSSPINTVADLVKYAKDHPGALSFASSGVGGANHLSGELLKVMAGIDMQHIPYRGAAPALNDVMAGHVPLMFDGLATVSKHLQEGKIKAIGITTLKRSPLAPGLPTINESGIKGFEVSSWFGLYGPSQMPPQALEKLSQEFQLALGSNEIRDQFSRLGVTPGEMDTPTFTSFVDEEMKKWAQVIANAKIPKQ